MLKPASETIHFRFQRTGWRERIEIVAEGHAKLGLLLHVETVPGA
jgi:hypothetical protein